MNMIQKHHHLVLANDHLKWTEAKWIAVLWKYKYKFQILYGNTWHCILWTKEGRDHPACYHCPVQKPSGNSGDMGVD